MDETAPEVDLSGDDGFAVDDSTELTGAGFGTARIVSSTVGAVLVGLIVLFAFAAGGGDDDNQVSELLAQRAPSIAGTTVTGEPYDIDDHRGSWVLVNFFATWCPGCVNEHDDLVALESWGANGGDLELVSVVFNDPVDRVEEFFDQRGGTWPVLEDRGGTSGDFGVLQIPESFLVSPAGQVVLHVEGEVTADEVVRIIEEAR